MNMRKILFIFPLTLAIAAACVGQTSPVVSPAPMQQKGNNMFTIKSSVFENEGNIPDKYTCKGQSVNPPLEISGVPEGAKSLALILHDPDAPLAGGFTHWVMYNIDPKTSDIAENSVPAGAVQGNNGAGKPSYTGPCPPSGTHRYYFYVYALDTVLQFQAPPNKAELEQAMQGHILEQGELMGKFSK